MPRSRRAAVAAIAASAPGILIDWTAPAPRSMRPRSSGCPARVSQMILRVARELADPPGVGKVQRAEGRGGGRRRQGGVEQEGARGVDQVLAQQARGFPAEQRRPALGAERLGERRGDDHVPGAGQSRGAHRGTVLRCRERMCLVHHQQGAVAGAEFGGRGQRGRVPEHRVDGFENHGDARLGRRAVLVLQQQPFDVPEAVVLGGFHPRAGEPGAVDQAGVGVGVEDEEAAGPAEGTEHAEVRGVAAGEDQRLGPSGVPAQRSFQLAVDRQGARGHAAGGGPGAVFVHGRGRGGPDLGVPAQAQVVVGGQVRERTAGVVGALHAACGAHPRPGGQPGFPGSRLRPAGAGGRRKPGRGPVKVCQAPWTAPTASVSAEPRTRSSSSVQT